MARFRSIVACVCMVHAPICALLTARTASAQSEEELTAARKLFSEALSDQEQKKFAIALDKFRRVKTVKDTAPVRYRIAMCLEALGRLDAALEEYDAAVTKADATQRDVSTAASRAAANLRLHAPHLELAVDEGPTDLELRVDGEPVTRHRAQVPLLLSPGAHTVDADAKGYAHFHTDVSVRDAETARVRVHLTTLAAQPDAPQPAPARPREGGQTTTSQDDVAMRTWGFVAIGAGGAAVVSGIVVLALRAGDISFIERTCPQNVCPTRTESDVTSAQSRARTFAPLGWTLVGVGAAAVATGIYLTLASSSSGKSAATVAPTLGGAKVEWTTRF